MEPKTKSKNMKWTILGVVIIVIIVAGVVGSMFMQQHPSSAPSISLGLSSLVADQGTSISFSVFGLQPNAMATVWFGDGQSANTTSSVTYTYQSPGKYLVAAQEYMNGQPVASTFNALRVVQVTPKVDPAMAPKISIPTLAFNLTKNPSAPVVQTGDMVYLAGGFLEAPSGANISISNYAWDFGNTVTKTVAANATSLEPTENPVTATYSASGLYPVKLTLTTEDKATMNTYTESVEQTVAVGTASQPDALFLYSGKVPNPNVINVAENVAGGPYSFDPQVDYESVGFEVISNIYSTLIIYNGSSTTEFIPEAATQLPSTTNGQISPDFTSYTFQVRTGLKFSNGDPLTSYDVWYSIVRDMLFIGGAPGTPDWILAQYLISGATIGVPIMSSANDTDHFNAIMAAVTYSNSSNTVTFKLAVPTSAQLFFTALADPLGAAIIDANWVEQIGAGVTFTPAGFYGYQSQGNEGSYNTKLQQNPVTSGPYQIESYVPGQSVTLIPNSGFQGVPGIPTVNNTVVIQWVKDPETAYNLFTSGQVDMLAGASPPLPTNYFPLLKQQVASGQAALYQFPTLSSFFFIFNVNTNTTLMKTDFGSQYNMPSDYFANLDIRQAFAYAFNYTNYIDQIEGNAKYGIDFGSNYAGLIIQGLPYHVPESELQNVPTYDLTQATQLLHQSGLFDTAVNIPIAVTSGDTVDFAAAQMWAAAVNSIDPNIVLNPTYIPFSTEIAYSVPGQNPMPIYYLGWIADYPYPSDFVDAMYKQGGTYPSPDGWTSAYLNQTGHSDQGALYAQMNSLIKEADSTTDPTIAASDYKQAEQIAINLYMYVYSIQPNEFWVVKSYMNGYGGQINIQENSMIAGAGTGLYFWWTKG